MYHPIRSSECLITFSVQKFGQINLYATGTMGGQNIALSPHGILCKNRFFVPQKGNFFGSIWGDILFFVTPEDNMRWNHTQWPSHWSVWSQTGVDRKLSLSSFDRRQFRWNPSLVKMDIQCLNTQYEMQFCTGGAKTWAIFLGGHLQKCHPKNCWGDNEKILSSNEIPNFWSHIIFFGHGF